MIKVATPGTMFHLHMEDLLIALQILYKPYQTLEELKTKASIPKNVYEPQRLLL